MTESSPVAFLEQAAPFLAVIALRGQAHLDSVLLALVTHLGVSSVTQRLEGNSDPRKLARAFLLQLGEQFLSSSEVHFVQRTGDGSGHVIAEVREQHPVSGKVTRIRR